MDRSEFSDRLNQGEDTWLDWKRDFPRGLLGGQSHPDWDESKASLPKDLVSLANSDAGRPAFLGSEGSTTLYFTRIRCAINIPRT
jgi:hypothetical protein